MILRYYWLEETKIIISFLRIEMGLESFSPKNALYKINWNKFIWLMLF